MADEKKTPAPEEPGTGKSPDAGKATPNAPAQGKPNTPEKPEGSPVADTPQPPEEKAPENKSKTDGPDKDGAEVVVPIEKISELIAQRNRAAREQVEQTDTTNKAPEDTQTRLFETAPTPKRGGRPPKLQKSQRISRPRRKSPGTKCPKASGARIPRTSLPLVVAVLAALLPSKMMHRLP